jgi:hypothetical protein
MSFEFGVSGGDELYWRTFLTISDYHQKINFQH